MINARLDRIVVSFDRSEDFFFFFLRRGETSKKESSKEHAWCRVDETVIRNETKEGKREIFVNCWITFGSEDRRENSEFHFKLSFRVNFVRMDVC